MILQKVAITHSKVGFKTNQLFLSIKNSYSSKSIITMEKKNPTQYDIYILIFSKYLLE